MTRLHRILRLARLRGDLVAIANLEGIIAGHWRRAGSNVATMARVHEFRRIAPETESELRMAWGDR